MNCLPLAIMEGPFPTHHAPGTPYWPSGLKDGSIFSEEIGEGPTLPVTIKLAHLSPSLLVAVLHRSLFISSLYNLQGKGGSRKMPWRLPFRKKKKNKHKKLPNRFSLYKQITIHSENFILWVSNVLLPRIYIKLTLKTHCNILRANKYCLIPLRRGT